MRSCYVALSERAWELVGMISPVKHAESADGIAVYTSEPYVIASGVYSLRPHAGRRGWTWYTDSPRWRYRLILESLLGLSVDSDLLHLIEVRSSQRSPAAPVAEWAA